MTTLSHAPVYAAAAPPPVVNSGEDVRRAARAFVQNYAATRFPFDRARRSVNPLDVQRNIDLECDFPSEITVAQYQEMDERQGLGARVNAFWAEACWESDPDIYENPKEGVTTPWEEKLAELIDRHNLYEAWERLDRNAGVGEYGVMLYFVDGLDEGADLEKPAPGVTDELKVPVGQAATRNLLYLRIFPRHHVEVLETEQNDNSPRRGQPTFYNLKMAAPDGRSTADERVHWSWIIHVPSDDVCSNEWTGHPRTRRSFNYLLGARKITSADPEAVYKGGFPGISFEADAVQAAAAGFADPTKQAEFLQHVANYMGGTTRAMLNIGIKANQLQPGIADPTQHLEAQLKMIGITMGVPWRVLVGSEVGQLASGQDTRRVSKRTRRRCEKRCTPRIVRPTLDRLAMVGVLPGIKKYFCDWPDPDAPSDQDKADVALKVTQAWVAWASSPLREEMTFLDYAVNLQKMDRAVAQAMEDSMTARATEMEEEELDEDDAGPADDLGPSSPPTRARQ